MTDPKSDLDTQEAIWEHKRMRTQARCDAVGEIAKQLKELLTVVAICAIPIIGFICVWRYNSDPAVLQAAAQETEIQSRRAEDQVKALQLILSRQIKAAELGAAKP